MFHVSQDDHFAHLCEAVFRGDLAKAEAALIELERKGGGEVIRFARRRARPELVPELPPVAPFVLPQPGAKPGDTMASGRRAAK